MGVELSLNPVGPDPVKIVLDCFGVDQTSRVEGNPCTDQLYWFLHFRGLGKLSYTGKKGQRVYETIGPCSTLDYKFPWYPSV